MSNAFNPSIVIYFDDLFAKIQHYFSTVIGAIVWVHTDNEVVLKDIDKKKQQHKASWNTAKRKLIVRFLGNTDPNCCEWWHRVSLGLHTLHMEWIQSK